MQKGLLFAVCATMIAAVGFVAWARVNAQRAGAMPAGIAWSNGRLEATQVNIATKDQGRVAEILAKEGDSVDIGQIVARMDMTTLNADRAKANASLAEAQSKLGVTESAIARCESELKLAQANLERSTDLFNKKVIPKQDFEQATTNVQTAKANLTEQQATLKTLQQSTETASAEVQRIQTQIDDCVLKSPVQGRVLYRLAEPGEVLSAGGKVLTLVNLTDVYMEIYLPSQEAARVHIGAEARITLDAAPGKAAKAEVSFVAPEAQFTPKQVETRSERDKLMFRVKLSVPPERVKPFIERIKTGIRGVGFVRYDDQAVWPDRLEHPFIPPEKT